MLTAEDQGAAVGSREMHVEHLDGGELVEHGPGGEAGGERLEPCAQRDVQTVGQEGDEDVRLDAVLELMVDRAQVQIVLHGLEGPRSRVASSLSFFRGLSPPQMVGNPSLS
jgi:hypothetical protein